MLTEGIAGQDLFSGRQLGSFERASNVLAGGFGLFTAGWGGAFGEAGSLAEGAGSTCSFDQNTPVATDKGETPIGQLQVGDKVLAYDQQSSTTGYYTVTAVLVNQDPTIEHLTIDDETLTTTPEHPFFTEAAGWVAAGELKAGEHVRRADGSWGEVHQVQVVEQARTMYNLTVEKAHTFFVGDKQWLVHNDCLTIRSSEGGKNSYKYEALDSDGNLVGFGARTSSGYFQSHINTKYGIGADFNNLTPINSPARGGEVFDALYAKVQSRLSREGRSPLKGVYGYWVNRPDIRDNLTTFEKLVSEGKSYEDAAFGTFTGIKAKAYGFRTVKVDVKPSKGGPPFEEVYAHFSW